MPPQSHNPLWQYICEAYARGNTAQHCLSLQNRYGLDVNLLLSCGWIALHLGRIEQWPELLSATQPWQSRLKELRSIRNHLNKHDPQQGRLRAQVLALELEGEHREVEVIWETLRHCQVLSSKPPPHLPEEPGAADVFDDYLHVADTCLLKEDPDLRALASLMGTPKTCHLPN